MNKGEYKSDVKGISRRGRTIVKWREKVRKYTEEGIVRWEEYVGLSRDRGEYGGPSVVVTWNKLDMASEKRLTGRLRQLY